jgi:hypothetical protein
MRHDFVEHSLDGEVAVLVETAVAFRFRIDVVHRIETDIAGDNSIHLQVAGAIGKDARLGVRVAFEDVFDDADHARVRRQDEFGARGLQSF